MKIGILREGKIPPDRRVVLSPNQCAQFKQQYPNVDLVVQPSSIRCFSDDQYLSLVLICKKIYRIVIF